MSVPKTKLQNSSLQEERGFLPQEKIRKDKKT